MLNKIFNNKKAMAIEHLVAIALAVVLILVLILVTKNNNNTFDSILRVIFK